METPAPRPRWYQISLREILALVVLAAIAGTAFVQSRQIEALRHDVAAKHAKQAPIYTGIVQGGVTRRDPKSEHGTTYIYCHGCKVEVYETFVLIHIDKMKPASTFTESQIIFIPRDALLSVSFQP